MAKAILIITDTEDGQVEMSLKITPPITQESDHTLATGMGLEISAMIGEALGKSEPLGKQEESTFRYAINRALMFLAHPQVGIGLSGWPAPIRRLHFMATKACEWAKSVNRKAVERRTPEEPEKEPEEIVTAR